MLKVLPVFIVLLSTSIAAHASVSPDEGAAPVPALSESTASEPAERRIGQHSFVELDAHVGIFSGLRLKGIVFKGQKFNLGIEGMAGGSFFQGAVLSYPATYGSGVRSEFYFTSKKKHAWMWSPGVDFYLIPRNTSLQSDSQRLGYALDSLYNVPTQVFLVSPNVDFSWVFQPAKHFGIVLGAKVGLAFCLSGTTSEGENMSGTTRTDAGVYAGLRF